MLAKGMQWRVMESFWAFIQEDSASLNCKRARHSKCICLRNGNVRRALCLDLEIDLGPQVCKTIFVSLSVLKGRKRVGDKKLAWIDFQAIVQETELEGGAVQGQGGRGALNYLLSSGGSRHQVG